MLVRTAMTMSCTSSATSGAACPFFGFTCPNMSFTLRQPHASARQRPSLTLQLTGVAFERERRCWTTRLPLCGEQPMRQKDGRAGRGAHVSEKDLRVLLCRLDTAMRAASCSGAHT